MRHRDRGHEHQKDENGDDPSQSRDTQSTRNSFGSRLARHRILLRFLAPEGGAYDQTVSHVHGKRTDGDNYNFHLGPKSENRGDRNNDPDCVDGDFVSTDSREPMGGGYLTITSHSPDEASDGGEVGEDAGKNSDGNQEQGCGDDVTGEIAANDVEKRSWVSAGYFNRGHSQGEPD